MEVLMLMFMLCTCMRSKHTWTKHVRGRWSLCRGMDGKASVSFLYVSRLSKSSADLWVAWCRWWCCLHACVSYLLAAASTGAMEAKQAASWHDTCMTGWRTWKCCTSSFECRHVQQGPYFANDDSIIYCKCIPAACMYIMLASHTLSYISTPTHNMQAGAGGWTCMQLTIVVRPSTRKTVA